MGSIGYVGKIDVPTNSPTKGWQLGPRGKCEVLAPARFENAMRPQLSFRARRQRLGALAVSVPPRRETASNTPSPEALMAGRAWHAKLSARYREGRPSIRAL